MAALSVAGCNSTAVTATSWSGVTSSTAVTTSAAAESAPSSPVTITDAWIKATAGTEDPSVTAAFGVLHNTSAKDLTVVSATNTVSDRTELHEMTMVDGAMVMRAIEGGIVVPANGTAELGPGGLHVMVLDATQPISPGDEVGVTLTMSDGSTLEFQALAKEFAGANEQYGGMTGEMMTGEMMTGEMMTGPGASGMDMTDAASDTTGTAAPGTA